MKYLIFYPDATIEQTNELTREQIENSFICDIYIFKFEDGSFYTLVDEGEVDDKLIWERVLTEKENNKSVKE